TPPASHAPPPAKPTYPPSACPPARSARATTAACDTLSCRTSVASISPGSIRKPRTLTCWSARPTNSKTPSPRQRAKSPLRYIRLPAAIPIRNKALTRQPATPNISPPNPSPRDEKLPNNTNRHRLQTTVQYINPRVPDRTTKRRCLRVIVIQSHDRRPDRSLCWSIEIGDPTPEPAQGKGEPVREGLAADQHRETLQPFGAVQGERMPEGGRALKDRAASLLDRACKRRRILDDLSRGDGETGTSDEGEE